MHATLQDQSVSSESNSESFNANFHINQSNDSETPSNDAGPAQRDLATPEANHPGNGLTEHAQVNRVFLRGLATLLGQFSPNELQAHQPGLLRLINDALADTGSELPAFESNTPVVVIQRLAGELA